MAVSNHFQAGGDTQFNDRRLINKKKAVNIHDISPVCFLSAVKENLFGMKFVVLFLVLTLVFLLAYPLVSSWTFFVEVPLSDWLSFDWEPDDDYFGMGVPLTGSLLLVLTTLPLALLMGWIISLQLVDNRKSWLNPIVVGILEVWISLPSVIIGVWAITQVIPFVRETFGGTGYSLLATSIGLTIFIMPTCALLFYRSYLIHLDQYQGLENSFQMSALSRSELFIKSQPTAVIGTANYIFCRIFGETMVVLMLSGNSLQIPGNLLEGFRTLTATIAMEMSYAAGMHETSLFAMASIAIVIILTVLLVQYKRLVNV
jgi:phosphate transport system permease protein